MFDIANANKVIYKTNIKTYYEISNCLIYSFRLQPSPFYILSIHNILVFEQSLNNCCPFPQI